MAKRPCKCVVKDWRGLRKALEMSQFQFAELLQVVPLTVIRYERRGPDHQCANASHVTMLRLALRIPMLQDLLDAHHFPHPWPQDRVIDTP